MADSGMFAMVRGHGISAFPSTILYDFRLDGVSSSRRTCAYAFLTRGINTNVTLE